MDFRNALKELREQKNVSQETASYNIIDQSNYSKIERRDRELTTELLFKFSKNMNATMVDLEELMLKDTPFYKATITQTNIRLKLEDPKKIFDSYKILNDSKHTHAYAYRSYLICKKVFHPIFPKQIPDITSNEQHDILANILNSKYHTTYDILNMAECVRYFEASILIKAANTFLPLTITKINAPNRTKLEALSILLVNIADLIIDTKHYPEAQNILDELNLYFKYNNNYKQSILHQYAASKIKILTAVTQEAKDQAYNHIGFLCQTLEKIFDDNQLAIDLKKEAKILYDTGEPVNYIFTTFE